MSTTTTDLALALYRENLAGELASQRETEAIRLLLADERDARRHGATTLLEGGLLAADDDVPTAAVVARLILRPNVRFDDLARIALEQALVASRRWTGPREAVHLVRYDHGVLLVHDRQGAAASRAVAGHLNDVLQTTIRGLPSVAGAVVGVGRPRAELSDVRMSYDEAALAAQVAVRLPAVGPVADWAQLGIYRVLSQLSADALSDAGVHLGLEKLIEDPAHRPLLETLETYLDLAGNAHATAVRMNLHRTSVYYRLQRIEQLAGTDLRSGNERLSLHLALKLARLTGPA